MDKKTNSELAKKSVGQMRRVGDRTKDAEKMSRTLELFLEYSPDDEHTIHALGTFLHEHLADTVTMLDAIPFLIHIEKKLNGSK